MPNLKEIEEPLSRAVSDGHLMESSRNNILGLLKSSESKVVRDSVAELVEAAEWSELNDRFFKTLAFGTGGLRGRTIGRIVTSAEKGRPDPLGRPQFPCTGTNAMNDFNVVRATLGLCAYVLEWHRNADRDGRPAIAIAHDTRHFSREFAELAADVASKSGVDVHLMENARSTPQLSFAVRQTESTAGVVLTASHNPPHDNGYKVYFEDGGQVVEPHAGGIIAKVNSIASDRFDPVAEADRGTVRMLGEDLDRAYMERLESLILQPDLVRKQNDMKVVFTAIHGTGGVITVPMLQKLGFQCTTVPEQDQMDGRFPTVKSPNPENAEALDMARALAEKQGADLVIGTDPDCDRMGVLARGADGTMKLLTGNQIGSLMAFYRTKTLFDQGILNNENRSHAVIIKTFVTTDLQKAIAEQSGIRCVETLTGFKYIGAKLRKYEEQIPGELRKVYRDMDDKRTRRLRLEHSTFYVFGGEESYGYSGADFVRDKDGNGAVVMFAETAAYAKSRGLTLDQLLDEIYATYGFYLEKNGSLVFEGAEGSAKIARLAQSYADNPPSNVDGIPVHMVTDYSRDTILDSEGDRIPAEKMLSVSLENGWRFAVRPSGTEPKIKYYLFASESPKAGGAFSKEDLESIKSHTANRLDHLWKWLRQDAEQRLAC